MKYDDLDKEIIPKLISLPSDAASLSNIFDEHFINKSLQIDPGQKQACFVFNTSEPAVPEPELEIIARKSSELTILLARYMNLYRFLDKEDLVFFYKLALGVDNPVFIGKADTSKTTLKIPVYDNDLGDLAWRYHHSYSIPSPALKELVSQDLFDDEERSFTKSLRASWVAIWISLALGLDGIVMNVTNNIDQDIKLGKQIEAFRISTETLAKSMKQLPGDFLKLLSEANKHSVTR